MKQFLMTFALLSLVLGLSACGGGPDEITGNSQDAGGIYAGNAFPPVLPNDDDHEPEWRASWTKSTCLNCHKDGSNDAPIVVHDGMSELLVQGKCRTCHTVNPE